VVIATTDAITVPGIDRHLTVAVVGLGYWGPNLIRNLHEMPSFRNSLACDLPPVQLAAVSSHFPR
jgi:hypothetical protein